LYDLALKCPCSFPLPPAAQTQEEKAALQQKVDSLKVMVAQVGPLAAGAAALIAVK